MRVHTATLWPAQVRSLMRAGCDTLAIAAQYGVPESVIWNILATGRGYDFMLPKEVK